jgi:tetratricopeptide (TPR) repeat protein
VNICLQSSKGVHRDFEGVIRAAIILAIAFATGGGATSTAQQTLESVPQPALENLERPIQEQLQEERRLLDELLATGQAGDGPLAEAYGKLGQLYFVYDLFEVAKVCFSNASNLDPRDFRWHYYLGVVYRVLGDADRSRASLAAALEVRPNDVPALLRIAKIDLDSNQLESADDEYRRALAVAPNSAAAHEGLGRLAFQKKDFDLAITHLTTALELQPKATSIHHLLGLSYRETGDLEKAKTHLQLNQFGTVTFRDPLVYGLSSLVQGARFHLERASRALEQNNLSAAIAAYREAISIDPDDPLIHYNLSVALERSGSREQAVEHLRTALDLNPNYRDAHFNLGMALAAEGRFSQAAMHFERAYQLDPEDQVSHLEWAVMLYELNRGAAAERELRSILQKIPDDTRAQLYLGAILSNSGRSAEADHHLSSVAEHSDDPEERGQAYLMLGLKAETAGRDGEAIASYRAALALDPNLTEVHARLGGVLARQGQFEAAAHEFEAAVQAAPRDENLRFGVAMAFILAEEYSQARKALDLSLQVIPQSIALKHLLARLLATAPDSSVRNGALALDLALAVYSSQASLDHGETIAMAFAELGRYEEAVERQRDVVNRAQAQKRNFEAHQARQRLALYENGRPCRAPWFNR